MRHWKRHESFIIVDSGHHNDQILDFEVNNSHRGSGRYFLQSSLGVRMYSHEQLAGLQI